MPTAIYNKESSLYSISKSGAEGTSNVEKEAWSNNRLEKSAVLKKENSGFYFSSCKSYSEQQKINM